MPPRALPKEFYSSDPPIDTFGAMYEARKSQAQSLANDLNEGKVEELENTRAARERMKEWYGTNGATASPQAALDEAMRIYGEQGDIGSMVAVGDKTTAAARQRQQDEQSLMTMIINLQKVDPQAARDLLQSSGLGPKYGITGSNFGVPEIEGDPSKGFYRKFPDRVEVLREPARDPRQAPAPALKEVMDLRTGQSGYVDLRDPETMKLIKAQILVPPIDPLDISAPRRPGQGAPQAAPSSGAGDMVTIRNRQTGQTMRVPRSQLGK